MAEKTPSLQQLTTALAADFDRWDHIHEYGANDPFWPDGENINLVRNHIIYDKRRIEEMIKNEEQELTLFPSSYPEIYYRDTPPKMPNDFMARADEIRTHAREQMALYEQNPDFCYVRDHYAQAFPNGDTKATRAAGIYMGQFSYVKRYPVCIAKDDLVTMRSQFYPSYEKMAQHFAETAALLRDYLSKDHSKDDHTPVRDLYPEDEEELDEETEAEYTEDEPPQPELRKPSLDDVIQSARSRVPEQTKSEPPKDNQLTFF